MRDGSRRMRWTAEDGAVAVVAGLTLAIMILMAALVIDLGFMRADRVDSKAVADMAAAAAVTGYNPDTEGDAKAACEDAIAFATANLGLGAAVAQSGLSCSDVYDSYLCVDDVPVDPPATYLIGDYRIEVHIPVLTGDGLMEGFVHDPGYDGVGCERIGVRVQRDRSFLLAGVAGFGDTSTTQSSVARSHQLGTLSEYASLVVLRRSGCQTLENAGGGKIRVFSLTRWEDTDGNPVPAGTPGAQEVTYPGTVTIDTIPSGCSGGQKVIDAKTSTGSIISAEGDIFAYGLLATDPGNADTYPPAAVTNGNLVPRPKPGPLITRSLVDYQFNCLTGGYPGATVPWSPDVGNQPIDPCPVTLDGDGNDLTPPPYIKNLDDAIVASGFDPNNPGVPLAGWAIFPDDVAAITSCNGATGTVQPDPALPGGGTKWIINCPMTGPAQFRPNGLIFSGVDHVIFPKGLTPGTGDDLRIYGSDAQGTVVTIWEGGLQQDGGRLELKNVFVYIRSTASGSVFDLGGSTHRFALQAPLEDAACSAYGGGLPPAACFSPLAMWTNYRDQGAGPRPPNAVSGDAGGGVIGTLFAPNAEFRFRGAGDDTGAFCGQADWDGVLLTSSTLQLEGAQFFAEKINIRASAAIGMCPSPDTTLGVPIRGSGLIR